MNWWGEGVVIQSIKPRNPKILLFVLDALLPFILSLHHPFSATDRLTDVTPQESSLLSWAARPTLLNQWWSNWMAVQLLTISWRKCCPQTLKLGTTQMSINVEYTNSATLIEQNTPQQQQKNDQTVVTCSIVGEFQNPCNEKRQAQNRTYSMISCMWKFRKRKAEVWWWKTESDCFCSWAGEALTGKSHKGIFWGDGLYTHAHTHTRTQLWLLRGMYCKVIKLHLNRCILLYISYIFNQIDLKITLKKQCRNLGGGALWVSSMGDLTCVRTCMSVYVHLDIELKGCKRWIESQTKST